MKKFEEMTVEEIRKALEDFESLMTLVKDEHDLRDERNNYDEGSKEYEEITSDLSYNVYCSDEIIIKYEG